MQLLKSISADEWMIMYYIPLLLSLIEKSWGRNLFGGWGSVAVIGRTCSYKKVKKENKKSKLLWIFVTHLRSLCKSPSRLASAFARSETGWAGERSRCIRPEIWSVPFKAASLTSFIRLNTIGAGAKLLLRCCSISCPRSSHMLYISSPYASQGTWFDEPRKLLFV